LAIHTGLSRSEFQTPEDVLTAFEILRIKMATDPISYDKADLRGIVKAFKAMDEKAVEQAKGVSNGLATYVQSKIILRASNTRNRGDDKIAQGSRVSKSSKIGEIQLWFCVTKVFRRWHNSTALGRF
jgi:hypothetical protein